MQVAMHRLLIDLPYHLRPLEMGTQRLMAVSFIYATVLRAVPMTEQWFSRGARLVEIAISPFTKTVIQRELTN